MLIIDNMHLPIPRKASVYYDVMHTWTQALTVAENLVSGVAQSVNTGEALLGLSAWHIYPDICAIGQRTTIIEQNDHLVTKGGVVTLGLQEHRERDDPGITWSMPLAHLRYYGGAVSSQRTLGFKTTKVFFDRIILVAMGSAMAGWNNHDAELDSAMHFFIAFAGILEFSHRHRQRLLWPKVLANQARRVLSSDQVGRQEMARLVGLGRRRYGVFLAPDKDHPPPFFGLTNPSKCIRLLHQPDRAIATIRGMADHIPVSLEGAIMRHVRPSISGSGMIEYASIFPSDQTGTNYRWITLSPRSWDNDDIFMLLDRATYIKETLGELCGLLEHDELIEEVGKFHHEPQLVSEEEDLMFDTPPRLMIGTNNKRLRFWRDLELRVVNEPIKRDTIKWLKSDHEEFLDAIESPYRERKYELFLGDGDSRVNLYVQRQHMVDQSVIELPIHFVTKALESQIAVLPQNSTYFDAPTIGGEGPDSPDKEGLPSYYKSLRALAAAQEVFNKLPNAEVDLAVVSRSLSQAKWAQSLWLLPDFVMTRASAVACICMFESGELNLQPEDLEDVMAVSSSNNLYASEVLFCDPYESPPAHAFRHVIGNVGKPGLVLLLSPRNSILREPDVGSWEMVNHAPFNGRFEDNFASTSLHLCLTGYEQPVNINDHGDRDSVVHFVEAAVSAHERGLWHADLDLLRLSKRNWSRSSAADCPHDEEQAADVSLLADFASIDNWYEVLDPPLNPAIVRSQGNWIARLALSAIPSPKKQKMTIIADKPCCACIDYHRKHLSDGQTNPIFLC